ncbi:MAG: alpha-amylase/4-alpha-glucanotransferase domain-containing protein [Elusimicrobiota bacterium]|nr:alpha-amylase/4-alpha-glucanotransferase domain-containing protein [Elusimicrobiota bacterium]
MNNSLFAFGVHCHQPVGNHRRVMEECYKKSYEPFFKELRQFPAVKMNVHISGSLLEWIVANHPEFVELLGGMIKLGQVELLGGPFYEAILPLITESDIGEQIIQYSGYLRKLFGVAPRGMWLPERVWESYLSKPIAMAGMEYTLLDDTHFHAAGWMDDKLHGYYTTEHEGFKLNIFPILESLRYRIPYAPPKEVTGFIKKIGNEAGGGLKIMMDDVEKFGVWHGSYEHVYVNKWLRNFFKALEKAQDRGDFETTGFSHYMDSYLSDGLIYLPCSSYSEMGRWSMPYDAGIKYSPVLNAVKSASPGKKEDWMKFIRGGFFRNMLVKYPESDMMHKKMLRLSREIGFYRDYPEFEKMQKHLFRAQCNCAYWHGIFGGIYMRHLRAAIFHELLQCQKILHRVSGGGDRSGNSGTGYAGYNEVQFSNAEYCLRMLPEIGATVSEFSQYKSCYNLGFVLRRRREVYHEDLKTAIPAVAGPSKPGETVSEKAPGGVEKDIFYDWYDRNSFISHFFQKDTLLSDFSKSAYGEQGDFVNQVFKRSSENREGELDFVRTGHVWCGDYFANVIVRKHFSLQKNFTLVYQCKIKNNSDKALRFYPGTEMNLSPSSVRTAHFFVGEQAKKCDTFFDGRGDRVLLHDKKFGVKLDFSYSSASSRIWMFPVYTVCRLEDGLKKMYQGTSLTFREELFLKPGEECDRKLVVKVL